ncbi:MAG: type I restriction endonuclease subunit R [Symploca sp. SIO2G7]|nr:type I restriction endonuclease subunit R [Symploca sp. SIO2G7]
MVQTLAISKTITSMTDLQARFNLTPADSDSFFTEWHQELPDITELERETLDRIKQRFERHRNIGKLAEGTINLLLVSPLLDLAGFYDEPFLITTEPQVEILIESRDELLRGRIDTLVIQGQLWSLVVESKQSISLAAAIPQALAYMIGSSTGKPLYGMATDGDFFMFIKLLKQEPPLYDFSDTFSLLLLRQNKLYDVLQVLKKINRAIL